MKHLILIILTLVVSQLSGFSQQLHEDIPNSKINKVIFTSEDKQLLYLLDSYVPKSHIKKGDQVNISKFKDERVRIVNYLHQNGIKSVEIECIRFLVDDAIKNRYTVEVKVNCEHKKEINI